MGKYDDILAMSRPTYSAKHPPMARADRAKQFMPFASLRGFDDVIDDRQTLRVSRRQPSEDERETMDDCLRRIGEALSEGVRPEVSLLLFERDTARSDETGEWGRYREITGRAEKLRLTERDLRVNGVHYPLSRIDGIRLL